MNKVFKKIIIILFTFSLAGCSRSIHQHLQDNQWNVTSTSGSSYTADFSETTITFEQGVFQTGMIYTIKDDQIVMIDPKNEEEIFYEIKEKGSEIELIPEDKRYGRLILTVDNE